MEQDPRCQSSDGCEFLKDVYNINQLKPMNYV